MIKFFISRPVAATSVSILLIILGLVGLFKLPVTRFPEIAPPSVLVSASYPGANSETVTQSVLLPLEEAINGVDHMTYITSRATNSGSGAIQVYFKSGTDPDVASVNVQTRISKAQGNIPSEVSENGITVMPRESGSIMTINIYSDHEDDLYDETFLQAFAQINLIRPLLRVDGVAQVSRVGARDYSMRLWLNPEKLALYDLVPQDVMTAITDQNFEIAPGKFGETSDEAFETIIKHKGRLNTPEEFENIVIKSNIEDGTVLYLKDVARIEFGATNLNSDNKVNGNPGLTLNITQSAGSNAHEIDIAIREVLEELEKSFPQNVHYEVSYSVRDQIDTSINQLKTTLIEAFILVFLIVFLFLQDFRSTLIPAITIPVSIVGTFFFLQLFGFSLNVLTMFALVLSIGIVVDDAIVVVEAVHQKMSSTDMKAPAATTSTMNEITGAILSITMVMAAVFFPVGFMEGPSGVFYRQFAYTLATAILISALNALTLSPALCALFLKPPAAPDASSKNKSKFATYRDRFFTAFNHSFERITDRYIAISTFFIRKRSLSLILMILIAGGGFYLLRTAPQSFIPTEDDSFFTFSLAMPPGASLHRTTQVLHKADSLLKKYEDIETMTTMSGYNAIEGVTSPSFAAGYINVKKYKDRTQFKDINQMMEAVHEDLSRITEATFSVFPRPTVQGFGDFSGIQMVLQDRLGGDIRDLDRMADTFIQEINKLPEVGQAYTTFQANSPQYEVEIDVVKAKSMGVEIKNLMSTIRTYFARTKGGDFSRFGRLYRVYIQADFDFRTDPESFESIYVRNKNGDMVPITTLVTLKKQLGPETINRYNLYNSATINIRPSKGYSSGDVMESLEELAATTLPANFGYEWTGMSFEEKSSGSAATIIFILSLVIIYFLLSIQYESYILPLAVLLSLPAGLLGVYLTILAVGLENNIYVQVGVIMLIGLLAKNAILIVEFAIQERQKGASLFDSAIMGARLRFRPILMTSLAFVCGLIPLMWTTGPSAIGNHSISFSAAGGMIFGVGMGLFFIPLLYMFFKALDEKVKLKFSNYQAS